MTQPKRRLVCMWNRPAGVAVADQRGPRTASPACSRARRPTLMAYLRKPLSTWIRPSTSAGSRPARLLSYQTVSRNSTRVACSALALLQALAHRAQPAQVGQAVVDARRSSGLGGALLAIAAASAERTASASGSSTCAPARAAGGSAAASAASRPAASSRRRSCRCGRRHAPSRAFTKARHLGQRHAAWPARRAGPGTSTLPSFRPRSEITTRCGTPISSQSANIAPGRSPRSSSMHVDAQRRQFVVQRVGGGLAPRRCGRSRSGRSPPRTARSRPAR